ncbi:hypothetical protein BKA69DRAFT_1103056 [Paraphysoderma sedebokerense]|nr:hypothetical protein BKA69DRAFT_1103056 [Paraphysoderma sedebokerense]
MTIIVTSAASEKASFSIQIPESLPSPPPTYRTSSTSPTEPHAPPNPPPPYLPTDQLSPSFLSTFPTLPYIRRQSNRSASALNKHEGRKAIVLYVILATVFFGLAVTLSGFKIANGISRCISDGEIVLLGDEYGTPNANVRSANNRNDSTDSDMDGLTGIFLPDGNFNNTIQDQQMLEKCTELQGWTIAELVYGVVGILLYDFCILIFISVRCQRPLFSVRILNLLLALHFVCCAQYLYMFS